MSAKESKNPRSIRAKKAFREALLDLLKEIPFEEVSVSVLSAKAGYSRYTFYNHFDSKKDLLHKIIDEKLDKFFDVDVGWNMLVNDPEEQKKRFARFFQIWEKDFEIIKLIDAKEFDQILLGRLLDYFTIYFYEEVVPKTSLRLETLSSYVFAINAYVLVGTFREWIKNDMEISPEKMGILLDHYLGPKIKSEMLEKMEGIF
jgi:AcrR family transcriptional regulator